MYVLESNTPITLEKNDPFYNEIASFAEQLKNDILEINRIPTVEREKMLISQDRKQMQIEHSKKEIPEVDMEEVKTAMIPFKQSVRSIEILGQIIKNRKGSLPITQLVTMIEELYTTGFRTIRYLSSLLIDAKHDIAEMINEDTKNGEDMKEIQKRIDHFIQMMSFDSCVNVFTKIMHAGGHKDLKNQYNAVAKSMGTPAAKLISFGINSYYGTVTPEEVKDLADEFKGNIVALRLLRGRVKSYVCTAPLNSWTN